MNFKTANNRIPRCFALNKNKGVIRMARNEKLVPEAENGLNRMKYEVANEQGVNLKEGYNGDIKAKDAGKVGGNMVKKMIAQAENQMKGKK